MERFPYTLWFQFLFPHSLLGRPWSVVNARHSRVIVFIKVTTGCVAKLNVQFPLLILVNPPAAFERLSQDITGCHTLLAAVLRPATLPQPAWLALLVSDALSMDSPRAQSLDYTSSISTFTSIFRYHLFTNNFQILISSPDLSVQVWTRTFNSLLDISLCTPVRHLGVITSQTNLGSLPLPACSYSCLTDFSSQQFPFPIT